MPWQNQTVDDTGESELADGMEWEEPTLGARHLDEEQARRRDRALIREGFVPALQALGSPPSKSAKSVNRWAT